MKDIFDKMYGNSNGLRSRPVCPFFFKQPYTNTFFFLEWPCISQNNAIFLPLSLKLVLTTDRYISYDQKKNLKEIKFYITKPVNKKLATYGNGTQISFLVDKKVMLATCISVV